jgi:glycosyltransferase involved in cell wall biosynthesis
MGSPRPRVLFLTQSNEVWGAEQSLLLMLASSRTGGIQPTVCVARDSPLAPMLREMGIDVIEHRFAAHAVLKRTGSLSSASLVDLFREFSAVVDGGFRLRNLVRRFDLVVAYSLWQSPEILLAAKLARRKSVLDIHETFNGRLGKRLISLLAKRFSLVISPSFSLARDYGLDEAAVVIPRPAAVSGHPTSRIDNVQNMIDGQITVGIFGQISPHKGVLEVVRALAASQRHDVTLLVVGGRAENQRDDYEKEVMRLVGDLPGASRVIQRQPEIAALMGACDYIVNASHHEAFGRTVIEAIVHGAFPLVLEGGGPAEIVKDTGIGLVFSDVQALVENIKPRESGSDMAELVAAVKRRYSPESVAAAYFREIENVHEGLPRQLSRQGEEKAEHDV